MAPQRLSLVILAIALVFVGTLVGLRATGLSRERAAALERAESGLRSVTLVAEQYARRVFDTSDLLAGQIADRVVAAGGTESLRGTPVAHRWLAELAARSAGDYLMIVDARGRPVAVSHLAEAPDTDLSDRAWFRAHADGAPTHVGEALHSRITDELMFTFTRALHRPDGAFDGVVQVAVRTGFFQNPAQVAEYGPQLGIGLAVTDGRVLARTGLTPDQLGASLAGTPLAEAWAQAPDGVLRLRSAPDGPERLVAYRRLAGWPVVVTASLPVQEALASWRRSLAWSLEVLGPAAIGVLLLAALAIRMAESEARAREAQATANAALRDAAAELERRVAARTAELAASEQRFRITFDSTFQFMALLDRAGRVMEMNETALGFLGLPRAGVLGLRLDELPCWPDEATRAVVSGALAAAGAGRQQRDELPVRGGDGRLAQIDVSLRPARDAAEGDAWLVAEGHDVTELKAAEARLREAQKMEALGQLTGGAAHDFNNLLMVVLGNLGLLRKRLPQDDPRLTRLLDGAQQGAERGAALTARMLAFARRQELRPAPVDLAALVGGMRPLLERSAGPKLRVATQLAQDLPPALADANQIELALLNLVNNARDAMRGGGEITVVVATAEAPSPAAPPGILPGRYLTLAVRDAGDGMDAATLARATEPFFTTKGVGQGSGLGLSMVQGLAQQSGGGLRLASRPGGGTTAEIWLPVATAAAPAGAATPPPAAFAARGRTPRRRVLVVEADPLVAAGTAMMLEDLGHAAIVAASGEEALALLARDRAVDLVLIDHGMPGMSGPELAERLRRERPGLALALASGDGSGVPAGETRLPLLNKPYRQEELDALVRRLAPAAAA